MVVVTVLILGRPTATRPQRMTVFVDSLGFLVHFDEVSYNIQRLDVLSVLAVLKLVDLLWLQHAATFLAHRH